MRIGKIALTHVNNPSCPKHIGCASAPPRHGYRSPKFARPSPSLGIGRVQFATIWPIFSAHPCAFVSLQVQNCTRRSLHSDDSDSAERRGSCPHLPDKLSAQVRLVALFQLELPENRPYLSPLLHGTAIIPNFRLSAAVTIGNSLVGKRLTRLCVGVALRAARSRNELPLARQVPMQFLARGVRGWRRPAQHGRPDAMGGGFRSPRAIHKALPKVYISTLFDFAFHFMRRPFLSDRLPSCVTITA